MRYLQTKKRITGRAPQIHEEGAVPGDVGTICISMLFFVVSEQLEAIFQFT